MDVVTTFDPAAATSGTFDALFPGGVGKMLVINESNVNITLSFANGNTAYMPAGDRRLFCIHAVNSVVNWKQQSVLGGQSPDVSQVVVESYGAQEQIIEHYPSPLVRQTAIGNSLPVSQSVNSIANDGNASNTTFVEATVSGDGTSAVRLTNDAKLTLGNAMHPGQVSLDNGTITSDGSGNLTAQSVGTAGNIFSTGGSVGATGSGLLYSTTGNLFIGGSAQLDNGAITTDGTGNVTSVGFITFKSGAEGIKDHSGNIMFQNSGGDRHIQAGSGHKVYITINGVDVLSIDSTGHVIIKGTLTQNGSP